MAGNVLLLDDDTTAFVDFANGSSAAPPERCARDRVELIATTAVIVGDERALSAALRALGRDGLVDILPLLESAALSSAGRRSLPDRKKFLAGLRELGAQLTDEEVPKVTELRRVSPGDIVMAAATFLGFYLIIIQFVGIDIWATLQTAEIGWVIDRGVALAAAAVHRRDRAAGIRRDTRCRTGRSSRSSSPTTSPVSSAEPLRRPRSSSSSSASKV